MLQYVEMSADDNIKKRSGVPSAAAFHCSLLVAALGTKYWIVARARRISNPEESDGRINFGLFEGKKELNVAYGWRTYEIKSLVTFLSAPFKQFEILREKRLTDSS
ncbi:Protein of unknown function [Gryllus bimaculatus]|nr:Protein of unknown function [Gryllus bimaculatus]